MRTIAIVDANHSRKKGMILPFEQHSITFDDITYSVDMPQVTRPRRGNNHFFCAMYMIISVSHSQIVFALRIG